MKTTSLTLVAFVIIMIALECDVLADGVSADTVDKIVSTFTEKSNAWGSTLQKYALGLFRLTATLTVVMFGVKAVLQRHRIHEILGQFVMVLLFCGFIFAVINHYQEWSQNIINGLRGIGNELTPADFYYSQPLLTGFEMATTIIEKVDFFSSLSDAGKSLGFIIAAIVIMVVFALMTAQVVLIKCESAIVMNAAMILLGLGGSNYFKEYAINVMRNVLAVSFKLFVMQLVLGLGMEFIQDMSIAEAKFEDVMILIGVSIVLLALVKSLPDAIAGVINGSHVSSGSALGQATAAAAGGAVGAATAALGVGVGVAGASGAVKAAAQTSGASGSSGIGKVGQFGKALIDSHRDSRFDSGKVGHFTRMSSNAKKRLQEMKMRNMSSGGSNSGSGNSNSEGGGA